MDTRWTCVVCKSSRSDLSGEAISSALISAQAIYPRFIPVLWGFTLFDGYRLNFYANAPTVATEY